MVATAVLLLVHIPPDTPLVKVEVKPRHNEVTPVIGVGPGLTVTVVIAKQPDVGRVYVITAVPAR
jgi:hypothetical protein